MASIIKIHLFLHERQKEGKNRINDPSLCGRTKLLKKENDVIENFSCLVRRFNFCEHHKRFAPPGGKSKDPNPLNLFIIECFLAALGSKALLGLR